MRYNLRLYAITSALFALPFVALAQKNAPTTTTEAVPLIRVEEQGDPGLTFDWQLRPRPPIQFTPFEMVDPNTGKPVNAKDIIEVGGVKMTAGEFYRRLNETEQWLNAHGYSLRTDTVFEYYSPQLEMELADSERRLRELEAQLPLSGEPAGGDFYPAACTGDGRSFDTGWFGNSLFGARVVGQGGYAACFPPASASVQGNARLDGRLAGSERTLVTATASASALTNDFRNLNYSYSVNVQVLGNTVWGPSGSGSIPLQFARNWDWQIASIDWRSPETPLGCVNVLGITICLNGRVGVAGSLRLAAEVDLSVFGQRAVARPYGYLGGFAEAWIGASLIIVSAEAGVRGNLTFLNGGLSGEATGNFLLRSNYGYLCADYAFNTRLTANMTALSGNIEPFVRGCIWFFGWRCAEASFTLFSWDGIRWNRELGTWSRTFTIGCF
jgi:hypothetical protein